MDRLTETIAEETAHVRAGQLGGGGRARARARPNSRRLYAAESRAHQSGELARRALPEVLDALRRRHAAFQALLQTNLTVLATAHAVSEGIIRGVSGELARKRAPSTYGASGRANAPSTKASQPLALSRTL